MSGAPPKSGYSLGRLLLYFLKLGATGFGGPIALVGYMERDLVEGAGWLTREQYLRGLALSQLAPGPLAAQLAMYCGYVCNGFAGATLAGLAFVLPSFVMVIVLGALYVQFGGLPWMQAAFYGIGAAVIGIITKSAYKLARVTLGRTAVLWALCIVMGSVTVITGRENVWLFILCGFAALVVLAPPKALSLNTLLLQLPAVAGGVSSPDILLFFAKAGAFVFGSGLAIVPFLHGSVVEDYHWLNERQFLDAVAVAMITPGPVVITVGFIGYLVGNLSGAAAAAVGVFLPVWLVVVLLTPLYEKFASHPQVAALVRGVTSAATGAIAGAVIVLGQRALVDLPTMLIGGGTLLLLVSFRIPEPFIVLAAGSIGILLHTLR